MIDSAFKQIVESKTEDLETHFVYAGLYYTSLENELKSLILNAMKKYKIKAVMVTCITVERRKLITKERMEKYYKGKSYAQISINDDLETLFQDIQLGSKVDDLVFTYFLPKLTNKELRLVERKDSNHLGTFWYKNSAVDVDENEMKASESDSKYVHVWGNRTTSMIENPLL